MKLKQIDKEKREE